VAVWPTATVPSRHIDRVFAQMERAALAEADHRQTLLQRHGYLRSAGRAVEADEQLRLIEAEYGPRPDLWVGAYLYWDGVRESAETALPALEAQIDQGTDPLTWEGGAESLCLLEIWRIREGDSSSVATAIERLLAGADDADPAHGQNALCALTLRAIAAHQDDPSNADSSLAELVEVLDRGAAWRRNWMSLEAAWILEDRGDLGAAARVAGYVSGVDPYSFAGSTVHREAARLALAAGDTARASHRFRWYITARPDADPSFLERDREQAARTNMSSR